MSESTVTSAANAQDALGELVRHEPERHPLVLGFASPVGTRLDTIVRELQLGLESFGYTHETISLADFLDAIPNAPWGVLPKRSEPAYYEKRMDAGDRLRKDAGADCCLAALAISRISEVRKSRPPSCAFVLRSLKHPDEVELLRHVYGDAFWLIGVVSGPDERRDDFAAELTKAGLSFRDSRREAQKLMDRDEDDRTQAHGQHVEEVFTKADVFIASRRGHSPRSEVERFLDGIFGHPFFTPYMVEEAMRFAQVSGLRSASMGRQVGAVLLPRSGTAFIAGTNEVPSPGGGQYWIGDKPDHRDFQMGLDPNPSYTSAMLQELFERLSKSRFMSEDLRGISGADLLEVARTKDRSGKSVLSGTRAESVIEFTRCLHAEQAAICNAARAGISTQDSILVTTTFPCHECAKFIVGAGVTRVIFSEPYPRSMVRELYRDVIDTQPPILEPDRLADGVSVTIQKVPFSAFVGFSPTRYDTVFTAGERRDGEKAADFRRLDACPRGGGWSSEATEQRETVAAAAATYLAANLYTKGEEGGG